jgi:hypothetical protein
MACEAEQGQSIDIFFRFYIFYSSTLSTGRAGGHLRPSATPLHRWRSIKMDGHACPALQGLPSKTLLPTHRFLSSPFPFTPAAAPLHRPSPLIDPLSVNREMRGIATLAQKLPEAPQCLKRRFDRKGMLPSRRTSRGRDSGRALRWSLLPHGPWWGWGLVDEFACKFTTLATLCKGTMQTARWSSPFLLMYSILCSVGAQIKQALGAQVGRHYGHFINQTLIASLTHPCLFLDFNHFIDRLMH